VTEIGKERKRTRKNATDVIHLGKIEREKRPKAILLFEIGTT